MKIDPYLHAALLLKGADKEINEANISSVVKASGADVDPAKAKVLAEALKNVDFEEVLKAAAAPVAAAAPAAAAPAEGKKEEKKEEDSAKKEEAAAEGLASLFG
ncbi:50S ribosomal protein P1 [Candidatus Micrarchaeota archaeon CG10_big_fil_rev_8_21_14_0_10_45_29]|nr:MAG: 50S ribosomal protein P1 [Candidatus Micrarchaeota archaeon CG10_big_fil_rev_8_21_14_0_10_45_29]